MSFVQVNDAKGQPLTKILTGETVAQAKGRISALGILESSDGVALSAGDRITAEGAPYVFKPLTQQQQYEAVPEEYKQIAAFAKEEMDKTTKHKPMSEA